MGSDGLLARPELRKLRYMMARDLLSNKKVVHNLSEAPISDADLEAQVGKLGESDKFSEDFYRAYQRQSKLNISGSTGVIACTAHHHKHQENRVHGLTRPHNALTVTRNEFMIPGPVPRRCKSRSELF